MINNSNREFTILLVDDKPENLFSLEQILQKKSRKFIRATSGNEALKLVLKHDDIGLIMLDVQMPEMDGFEVAKILKSSTKTKNISVIFVTAISKNEHYVLKGFEEGAVDYLQKPLDVEVTQAKVNVFEQLYFYQQDLKATAKELERINKQLERFVYIVSHDLKSPLASIITILSSMQENKVVQENVRLAENVDMVYLASHHLSEMISSILQYSKQSIEQQTLEDVDTKELVSQVIFLLFPPKRFKIIVHDDMPTITTRKQKLQQVFQNLISNAIKYNDKENAVIEIGATDKGRFIEFFVKDNGPGISKKDHDRIFRLFEIGDNTPRNESSTGVGLNILKMLVEEQGGKIRVESNAVEGSTFFFEWSK